MDVSFLSTYCPEFSPLPEARMVSVIKLKVKTSF